MMAVSERSERPPRRMGRRAGAVLAGTIAGAALSLGTDMVMHAAGIFPPWGEAMVGALFVLAAAYRSAYSVFGSYIAARVAPDRPMQHALVLGVLNVAANVAGTLATWSKGLEFGPKWYPLSLIVLAMPCAWLGGRLASARPAAQARPEGAAAAESHHA